MKEKIEIRESEIVEMHYHLDDPEGEIKVKEYREKGFKVQNMEYMQQDWKYIRLIKGKPWII